MFRSCAPTWRSDADEVALVGVGGAPAIDGHGEEVGAQLAIVGEPAGGEDHRLARPDAVRLAIGGRRLNPDDAAVGDDESLHSVAGANDHAVALCGRAHRPDGNLTAV